MQRVTILSGLVAASSLVLTILAACSLTVSPGEYAQGTGEDDAGVGLPRPQVPPGGARVLLLAGQRKALDPKDFGFEIMETVEVIVQADGTVGNFFYDRAPPILGLNYAQALIDNGKLIATASTDRGRRGQPQIAFAPIDGPSGALTGNWSLIDFDASVQGRASTLLVKPSRMVIAGGFETVPTEDGGSAPSWNGKVFTVSVDIDKRTATNPTPVEGSALSGAHGQTRLVVNKDFLYAVGGRDEAGFIATVDVARIGADGTPGAFVATEPLPAPTLIPEVVAASGRLFTIGGVVDAGRVSPKVYVTKVNETDGTVGAWSEAPALPKGLAVGGAVFLKDKLYYFGGIQQNALPDGGTVDDVSDVIYALDVPADGTFGTWREVGKFPSPRAGLTAVVLP